jgi:hypothetical protein
MVRVTFPDQLSSYTNGEREVSCRADNYRDLLIELEKLFPGIGPVLEDQAVAIDGQIHQDAFLEPLQSDSEIFFLQKIEGG